MPEESSAKRGRPWKEDYVFHVIDTLTKALIKIPLPNGEMFRQPRWFSICYLGKSFHGGGEKPSFYIPSSTLRRILDWLKEIGWIEKGTLKTVLADEKILKKMLKNMGRGEEHAYYPPDFDEISKHRSNLTFYRLTRWGMLNALWYNFSRTWRDKKKGELRSNLSRIKNMCMEIGKDYSKIEKMVFALGDELADVRSRWIKKKLEDIRESISNTQMNDLTRDYLQWMVDVTAVLLSTHKESLQVIHKHLYGRQQNMERNSDMLNEILYREAVVLLGDTREKELTDKDLDIIANDLNTDNGRSLREKILDLFSVSSEEYTLKIQFWPYPEEDKQGYPN
jgi:hypothetical protein